MLPVLNVEQFQRFMLVIRKLGDRVEKEHHQFLRDSQRLEDRSATAVNGSSGAKSFAGSVDFESLVGRANGATVNSDTVVNGDKSWDDDVWGSILNNDDASKSFDGFYSSFLQLSSQSSRVQNIVPATPSSQPQAQSLPSSPKVSLGDTFHVRTSRLSTQPFSSTSFTASNISSPPSQSRPSFSTTSPLQPNFNGGFSHQTGYSAPPQPQPQTPNYNISLPTTTPQLAANPATQPSYGALLAPTPPMMYSSPLVATPPAMGSLLAPSRPAQPSWTGSSKKPTKQDWGDFDPLA